MALLISPNIRSAILGVLADNLTQIDVYCFADGGGPPADANAGTEGTLVASVPIEWAYGTSGTAFFIGNGIATAEGTIGYGRLADAGRTLIIQGSAGTSVAADFVFDKGTYLVDETVLAIGNIVQPES